MLPHKIKLFPFPWGAVLVKDTSKFKTMINLKLSNRFPSVYFSIYFMDKRLSIFIKLLRWKSSFCDSPAASICMSFIGDLISIVKNIGFMCACLVHSSVNILVNIIHIFLVAHLLHATLPFGKRRYYCLSSTYWNW